MTTTGISKKLNIGTKTPLLALIITIVFSILWLWIKNIKEKNYKIVGISFTILLVVSILIISIIPKTNFYKNIETELDYIEVDNPVEVLSSYKLIDHAIFGQRLSFLSKRSNDYRRSNHINNFHT